MIRAVVFLDYADVVRSARRTFGPPVSRGWTCEVDPMALAQLLVGQRKGQCELAETRIYDRIPDAQRDPEKFEAAARRVTGWTEAGARVIRRRTVTEHVDEQQSVTVALAVDLVALAWGDRYDVALVFAHDTELLPAVRVVLAQSWKTIELGAWQHPHRPVERLDVRGERVVCHRLDAAAFDKVLDRNDMSQPQS